MTRRIQHILAYTNAYILLGGGLDVTSPPIPIIFVRVPGLPLRRVNRAGYPAPAHALVPSLLQRALPAVRNGAFASTWMARVR